MKISFIKIPLILFLFCHLNCYSQKISSEYTRINNDPVLNDDEKDIKFQNLLQKHRQENKIDFLIADSFEISRWYWVRERNWPYKSIQLCKKNLKLMDSLNTKNESFYRRNLYGLGYYQLYDNFEDALITLKKLLIYKETDIYVLRGAHDIAEIYNRIGQYYLSKDYYNLSKTIAEEQKNHIYLIKNAIGIAQACKLINSSKSLYEGIEVLNEVITNTEAIKQINSIEDHYFHTMYNQLGNLYIDRLDHDFKNGKLNLEKALKIAIKLNDSELLNKTYNDLGVLYLKEESLEAQLYFEKALVYETSPYMKALINRNLSIHHLLFNNYTKSLNHIQSSIATLVNFDTSNVTNLPSKLDLRNASLKLQLIASLIDKANIWIKLGEEYPNNQKHLLNAIKTLELADFLAEETRMENSDQRSKLFWKKTASYIYIKATKTCFLLNNTEKAFYFIEKNKALLLLEDITLKIARTNSEIPEYITKREQKLKKNIISLEKLTNVKNRDSIQSHLLLAKDNYTEFIDSLKSDYRLYFKTLEPAKVIDIDTFREEFLNKNNAYIEYILGDDEGYGLAITNTNTQLFKIKNCEKLKDYAVKYRNLLESPFKDQSAIEHYQLVSYQIYKSLFPEEVQALTRGKKLTILPDYYLQNIPFESLLTSIEHQNYLIKQNEISYAYSLTFLNENKKVKRTNTNNIIAFAPVEFSSKLKSLPYTEDELAFIDHRFSSKVFLRKEATKERFIKESNSYNIIHIASHANANDSINPWISFYNKKVNLDELYDFKNSADLVVLSACNTSLGELQRGEGVMSLSRGFFNSGSNSVLPTLWEVNDKASVDLLKSFYINIEEGQNKSLALHNAKLEYLENNSLSNASPYYWASFILIGDAGTVDIEHSFNMSYYYLLGLILIITVIALYIRKIKPN